MKEPVRSVSLREVTGNILCKIFWLSFIIEHQKILHTFLPNFSGKKGKTIPLFLQ